MPAEELLHRLELAMARVMVEHPGVRGDDRGVTLQGDGERAVSTRWT